MLYAAKTDVGLVRERNEDSYIAEKFDNYHLFIVADGMGGHKSGELASRLAVSGIEKRCAEYFGHIPDGQLILRRAISETNREVFERAEHEAENSGMGTTVTCAMIYNGDMYIGHAGDSRAYILREDELVQLTNDHSYIAELVRMGQISQEEAENHPRKNVITRALGTDSSLRTDTEQIRLKKGDYVVICSDGLTNHVADRELEDLLLSRGNVEEIAATLLQMALRRGGHDNITVIVMAVEDGDLR